jgi:hypothetical protein
MITDLLRNCPAFHAGVGDDRNRALDATSVANQCQRARCRRIADGRGGAITAVP